MSDLNCFFEACKDGDLQIVKEYLESKTVDIEDKDDSRCTPLLLASCCGHTEIVKLLLECGANLESRDGYSSLNFASWRGYTCK